MSSPEQHIPSHDFQQSQLFRLQTLAQEQAFWLGVEGVVVAGYATSIGRQVMETLNAGLTPAEILAALNEGEQRSLPLLHDFTPLPADDLPPNYWQAIQDEAETYWANR